MRYAIGLDVGIASVGFATLMLDENDEPCRILRMGSRIFDAAESPKDGASLALPRREARSLRRRIRRRKHRLERIRVLLVQAQLLTQAQLEQLYQGDLEDVYALRARALDMPVTNLEFARILLHLAHRRGFKSNRKSDAADKENGKLLAAVQQNQAAMQASGYRTVAEMLIKDERFNQHKRNKSEAYLATVQRDMVEQEVRAVFLSQRRFGQFFATEQTEQAYLEILLSQRPFDVGPGGNSPYGGNFIEKMVGNCTFEPEQKRAAKACYSFEYCALLQKVNHISLLKNGQSKPLCASQRQQVLAVAFQTPELTYARVRKELQLSDDTLFAGVNYGKDGQDAEKKVKLNCLRAYHTLRKQLDKLAKGYVRRLTPQQLNQAGTALTLYKSETNLRAALQEADFDEFEIENLLELSGFSGFGHLSIQACDKIIPYLEQGMVYSEACESAGYAFKAHNGQSRQLYLPANEPEMETITSPVARRAIAQTIKVVNALIREQGESPVYLNIELARELARDFAERKQMERDMQANQAQNERIRERIQTEFGKLHPTGQDIVKLRLYEEQGGICLYSQQVLDISRLFEPGYVDVDHIVPYSICFDDTYKNKALVLSAENRQKGNRLPMEYLPTERRERFEVWVRNQVRDFRKRERLLKNQITDEEIERFKERNLQDTKTISRFLYNYISDHLQFAVFATGRKRHVVPVNGAVTSVMRKRWGLQKVRENGDLHHAVDAVVVASVTQGMIHKITAYSQRVECCYLQDETGSWAMRPQTGKIKEHFPYPWPEFRKELEARLCETPAEVLSQLQLALYPPQECEKIQPLFVSRVPRRKVTGPAHKETIRSGRALEEGVTVSKRSLTDLKLNKNGEIEGYYQPSSDTLLYNALKQRLDAFGGDAQKAFAQPFYKPKSNGEQGPLVKKVKLCEKTTLCVPLGNGAVADNDSMVRVDVFYVQDDGYYLVPIYVADTLKPMLPNRAIVQGKAWQEWREMKDEDFLFSLYPNDLMRVVHKKGVKLSVANKNSTLPGKYQCKELFAYYRGVNISTGNFSGVVHDGSYGFGSMGAKTLEALEKWQVDVLGNISKVKKEGRQGFNTL